MTAPTTFRADIVLTRDGCHPQKLTDKTVKSLPVPSLIWDHEVKGFGIRVTAAGARAFVLNYRRKADARERRWTIGSFPDWGTAAAREEAEEAQAPDRRRCRSCWRTSEPESGADDR